ncbi:MAG: hypothetical protein Q4F79_03500 [Eubacteriales bacterium]|nr:hypothetical protein [Eubacteriales bacterium]
MNVLGLDWMTVLVQLFNIGKIAVPIALLFCGCYILIRFFMDR